MRKGILIFLALLGASLSCEACTSAIAAARATRDGRPIMWKHRDTDNQRSFVARHQAPGEIGYVALYNAGDTTLREAWTGLNDEGFAIMNTAVYNLPQDAAVGHDREGLVMARALAVCRSVDDFAAMLDTMARPYGVEANFGVIDAKGGGAYFETSDFGYRRFDASDAPDGVLIRSNYATTGDSLHGMGYIRYLCAEELLKPHAAKGDITPETFTEELSRSWYHGLIGRDMSLQSDEWLQVGDFIPRPISTTSIAIEGVRPGEGPEKTVMWTALGFPPCSYVVPVTADSVPSCLAPTAPGYSSPQCEEALQRKARVFPITRGNGKNYLYLPAMVAIDGWMRPLSAEGYREGRKTRSER